MKQFVIYVTDYGYRLEIHEDKRCVHESMHATKKDAERTAHMAGAILYGVQP